MSSCVTQKTQPHDEYAGCCAGYVCDCVVFERMPHAIQLHTSNRQLTTSPSGPLTRGGPPACEHPHTLSECSHGSPSPSTPSPPLPLQYLRSDLYRFQTFPSSDLLAVRHRPTHPSKVSASSTVADASVPDAPMQHETQRSNSRQHTPPSVCSSQPSQLNRPRCAVPQQPLSGCSCSKKHRKPRWSTASLGPVATCVHVAPTTAACVLVSTARRAGRPLSHGSLGRFLPPSGTTSGGRSFWQSKHRSRVAHVAMSAALKLLRPRRHRSRVRSAATWSCICMRGWSGSQCG